MSYSGSALVKIAVPGDVRNGAFCVFTLKEEMKARGWTVPRSSDGTTVNHAGDQITHPNHGAGGMDNNRAWFVAQQPAGGVAPYSGTRQLLFQRDVSPVDSGYQWRISYSFAIGWGATGTATETPTQPADAHYLLGGGTPAAPTYDTLFAFSGNLCTVSIQVGDVDENFSFCMFVVPNAGTGTESRLFMDGLTSGSFDPLDVDPFVFHATQGAMTVANLNQDDAFRTWFKKGIVGEGFVTVRMDSSTNIPNGLPISPYDGKDPLFQIAYLRRLALSDPKGFKGVSHLFRWPGRQRAVGDTLSVGSIGARDRMRIGDIVMPWPGSIGGF